MAASIPIRAKLGKPIGGQASFGYRWEGKELIVDEKEAPIRKLVYELFRDHKRKGVVAKLLNEKGYRTRNGSLFTDTTIGRLLRDSTAKGIRIANYSKSLGDGKSWVLKPESEWIKTPCPAIVSEELWNECNLIMDEQDKKKQPVAKKPVHLFTGILYCDCGEKMYIPSKSKKYICYSCRNKILSTDLEEIFYQHLKSFLLTDQHIGTFLSKADAIIIEKESQVKALKKETERIEKEMEKLVSLHVSGEIPKEGFGRHYNPLSEQLKQIEAHLPELQSEIDFLKIEHINGGQLLHEAKNLHDRWPTFDTEAKRQVVEQVTKSLSVSKDEIKITFAYTPSFFQIAPDSQRNFRGS
ncbi:MAG TPA: recombinase family protein [Bacteroidia bacterium]|nr:recombinase family protein [Bacteroidia bacterium]